VNRVIARRAPRKVAREFIARVHARPANFCRKLRSILKSPSTSSLSLLVIHRAQSSKCSRNNERSNGDSISYRRAIKSQFVQRKEWRWRHATLVVGYSTGNFADLVCRTEAIFLSEQYTSARAISKDRSPCLVNRIFNLGTNRVPPRLNKSFRSV